MPFVLDCLLKVKEFLLQLQFSCVAGISCIQILQGTEVFLKETVLQLHDDLPFHDVVVGKRELEGEFDVRRVYCVIHVAEEGDHGIGKWSLLVSEKRIEDGSRGEK